MTVTFVYEYQYFNCCIPDNLGDYDIKKINITWNKRDNVIADVRSDYWILFRPDFIPAHTLASLQGRKIWISTEPIEREDTLWCMEQVRHVKFDYVTHYDKTHIDKIRKMGIRVDEEFQLPVNLRHYTPEPSNLSYDVMFTGRSTPHREQMLKNLKRDFKLMHVINGLLDKAYVYFASATKVNLNIHIDSYPQLQHRMQNMMACGAFVISEPLSHNDSFKPGIHFIECKGRDDLYLKTKFYLEHADDRVEIQNAALQYTQENYNAEKNWLNLIQKIG